MNVGNQFPPRLIHLRGSTEESECLFKSFRFDWLRHTPKSYLENSRWGVRLSRVLAGRALPASSFEMEFCASGSSEGPSVSH